MPSVTSCTILYIGEILYENDLQCIVTDIPAQMYFFLTSYPKKKTIILKEFSCRQEEQKHHNSWYSGNNPTVSNIANFDSEML